MYRNYLFLLFFLGILSCKKEKLHEDTNIQNECINSSIDYNYKGEILYWKKDYFLNGHVVKTLDSIGLFENYKYDNRGNLLEKDSNGTIEKFEYDSNNKVTKYSYYWNGSFSYYYINKYIDTLLISTSYYDLNNQKTDSINYYYNQSLQLDSVVKGYERKYYYHFSDFDSIVFLDKGNVIRRIYTNTYQKGNLIRFQSKNFNPSGNIIRQDLFIYAYNERNLVAREIIEQSDSSEFYRYCDYRNTYNEFNQLIRLDSYNKSNIYTGKNCFIYNGQQSYRMEFYDKDNVLTGYRIIETGCK